MTPEDITLNVAESTACTSCGAPMTYKPSAQALVCDYCGTVKKVEMQRERLHEVDFLSFMQNYTKENFTTTKVVTCKTCDATTTINENFKSIS
ncbi:hypothetical protein [Myroides odoratus]|uniref:hypothetical protein n=1 Tax=Myroides odoratus TaxID=256 RepID=UPI003340A23A